MSSDDDTNTHGMPVPPRKFWVKIDRAELLELLEDSRQLLDRCHKDGVASWTTWDESVHKRLSECIRAIS